MTAVVCGSSVAVIHIRDELVSLASLCLRFHVVTSSSLRFCGALCVFRGSPASSLWRNRSLVSSLLLSSFFAVPCLQVASCEKQGACLFSPAAALSALFLASLVSKLWKSRSLARQHMTLSHLLSPQSAPWWASCRCTLAWCWRNVC